MAATDNLSPVSPDRTRVGFVGIGNMGTPMAGHLVRAGWRVQVYDIDPARTAAFVGAHGGSAASSLAELARQSDVVITMLPDGKIVRRAALGDGAGADCLVPGLARGSVIVDMSVPGATLPEDLKTVAEIKELAKTDPVKANELIAAGKFVKQTEW